MAVLDSLKTALLTSLDPFLIRNGGQLQEVRSVPFTSVNEIGDVMERFKPRVPVGLLSLPRLTYETLAVCGTKVSFKANYLFACVSNEQTFTEGRERFYFNCLDLFNANVTDTFIPDSSAPSGIAFRFIGVEGADFVEETDLFGVVWQIGIQVQGRANAFSE